MINPTLVEIDGATFDRSVQLRCPNIGRHTIDPERFPGCPCHPTIPEPCPDCYAIEMLTRRVPWSFLGKEPQPGSAGESVVSLQSGEGPT